PSASSLARFILLNIVWAACSPQNSNGSRLSLERYPVPAEGRKSALRLLLWFSSPPPVAGALCTAPPIHRSSRTEGIFLSIWCFRRFDATDQSKTGNFAK